MDKDEVRKKLREALFAPPEPPLDATRTFLFTYYSDIVTMAQVEKRIARMAKTNTSTLRRGLAGIEGVLIAPPEPGVLNSMVAVEIGIVVEPATDEGTKAWLKEVALVLRRHLAPNAPPPPPGLYGGTRGATPGEAPGAPGEAPGTPGEAPAEEPPTPEKPPEEPPAPA
jgi:hypothetical protein